MLIKKWQVKKLYEMREKQENSLGLYIGYKLIATIPNNSHIDGNITITNKN